MDFSEAHSTIKIATCGSDGTTPVGLTVFLQSFSSVLIILPFLFLVICRRVRITASGGEVGRLNTGGGAEVFFLQPRVLVILLFYFFILS